MDDYLALFPFTHAASDYVKSSGKTFEDLVTGEAFSTEVLTRSSDRIKQALTGEIERVDFNEDIKAKIELFSYPVARVMVSCINDRVLNQKYASGEARFALQKLKTLDDDKVINFIDRLLKDFNIAVISFENRYTFHFTDFVRFTSRLRDSTWKLVNVMNRGQIELAKNEVMEILREVIRLEVYNDLPLKLPNRICRSLSSYTENILANFDLREFSSKDYGPIDTQAYPPCIEELISLAKSGKSLTHPARFALTAFLANIGMSADEIMHLYENSPDFDFELTRYQVEHIMGSSGTEYTSPGCSTMETYGNCNCDDQICKHVSHPLSYYHKRLARKMSSIGKSKDYDDTTV